ncbi:PAS domain-containing hybrid sensor histidine kinase/response regulator [Phyllobacterium endophyticum]|uniref:histidine kinase n=1 Tax=Phyllobacterium endophyticum TaxID=1149773 RepID=A0A2P7AUH9_9HYPH|nr:PAS domain-containing hybrid sensor histidine kinase/response regulator [Phyllobacterium endophyticum]MBB3234329.1 PAS domain S-box-containing protein [Phyllobacterium endophyticum]PSH57857.1 hybrid sensor histidine kinase/response regulator [Phyllobacterium endophyticum]TYR44064.1 response regulator [Phyllobacterium endophyticum]
MPDLESLCRALGERVTFVVTTEEAIRHADLKPLSAWVEHQPSWSDLPFIVLTQRGGGPERNPAAARVSEILRNVTFFERPFHATSFISIAKTARRARARQYEALGRMEELSEGERRLQTALRAGRLGSWEYDLATGVLVTSDVCKAVFGRNPDDSFTDTELLGTIHPDDRGTMQSLIDKAISSGEDFELECRTIWQDSSPHWAEFRGRAVRDRHGNVSRLVGVSSDITARKIAEKELIELNGTLEDRVVERTLELHDAHQSLLAQVKQREIAEEQLRQAQKMEAIGHLTGGVAHDFNNLLMAVLGNLDLLRKHCMNDPKATRLIDGALKGAQRGAALTQRLLAFARRQDLKVEPVDLIELVRGMNDLLRRSVGSNIQLNYDLPAALPPVLADANQIELALLNLVVNSRDAISKSGEIGIGLQKMEVAASTQDLTAGTYVVMSVRDNGQGMTPETLERAIDPFFSTKELGKGTGLGLSMIHGLAVQLKGALRLSSSTGAGTKAELWLPVSTGSKSSANPGVEVSPEIVEAKFRILMVDDDALIAMSTVDMLEDLGHEVIEAHSGKDALEILEAGEEVDLLITDYSMPKMTGAELAKAARLLKPGLPVLIATGYADLPPGMDIDIPRLAKPYTQADLASHIAKALAN